MSSTTTGTSVTSGSSSTSTSTTEQPNTATVIQEFKMDVDDCVAYKANPDVETVLAQALSAATTVPVSWIEVLITCQQQLSRRMTQTNQGFDMVVKYIINVPTDADINVTANISNVGGVSNLDDFYNTKTRDITLGI
eukprot:812951-Amphidinium_carterae.2